VKKKSDFVEDILEKEVDNWTIELKKSLRSGGIYKDK
jgi:hypothetical protein